MAKIPSRKFPTGKKKIPSSKFPTAMKKIPSRPFPTQTTKIPSRKFAKAATKKDHTGKSETPLGHPTDEQARRDAVAKLKKQADAMKKASE